MLLLSKLLLAATLVSVVISVTPILAAEYVVGVKVGDWVKYETTGTYDGTGTEPPWVRYDWLKFVVQNVSYSDITFLGVTHYKDGTEESNTLSLNVRTGGEMWIIAAGLEKGDPIAVGSSWIVNDTLTRTYIGASRSVNFLSISQSSGEGIVNATFYWDQATGVLLETSSNKTSPTETWMLRYEAIETNLWGPVPLQLSAELSKDTVTQGDIVTVSATVNDDLENPIEGATVTATIGDFEVLILFSDQGNGDYLAEIDTSIVGRGSHEIVVTAEKEGYGPSQTSVTLTVETLRMQMTIQLSKETVRRGDRLGVSANIKDLAGNYVQGATVTVYLDDKAVDLVDQGDGEYQVDIDTSDVQQGTYTIIVSAHKDGYESTDVSETLKVETRILQVTIQLSTDTATQGDIITVSATVKDLTETPIEGATVSATLEHKTVTLSDQGNGNYQTTVDTSDLSEGTHAVTVTAEKEWCEPGQNSETLTIEAPTPWTLYGGIAAIVVGIAAVALYLVKRRS